MIAAILIALLVTAIIYVVATLVVRKLPVPGEFVWLIWLIAIILIVLVWWRVIAPYVGPLPRGATGRFSSPLVADEPRCAGLGGIGVDDRWLRRRAGGTGSSGTARKRPINSSLIP